MSALFSETKLRGLTLRNRIIVSPMCQYVADNGAATEWHVAHLGSMALSGAGLVIFEATAVEADGRITPGDLGLWDDRTEAALKHVITSIRSYSKTPLAIQIAHAGRKASSQVPWEGGQQIPLAKGGWVTSSASALTQKPGEEPPAALDDKGLKRILDAFVATAQRAARLGVDAIELHCAHGYLMHEFLSPISNQRSDRYGGSLENRLRFPLEVFTAVRAVFPADKPVGVKVSATDWVEGGWDIDQTIAFVQELKKAGLDWVAASSGGISPLQKISAGPGYQVPFAEAIKKATGVHTMAVGLITEPEQAEKVVADGHADSVALARAMLYDPRWPWHAAAALGATVEVPPSYWRAAPHEHKDVFGEIVNGNR